VKDDRIARIEFAYGSITLHREGPDLWKWHPAKGNDDDRLLAMAMTATRLSNYPHYVYSPAHGEPGRKIGYALAAELNGRAYFPPLSPADPEVAY
jgi:hypothetical protein